MDSLGQHSPVKFHIQFSIVVIIMIMFIILDSHYHPPWPLVILHDHHPILQDDHDQGVSGRHCLALGGGLVTGWGVAQTALHYYWFRWWGLWWLCGTHWCWCRRWGWIPMVIAVESGLMIVVTIVVTVLPCVPFLHFLPPSFLFFCFGKQTHFFEPRGSV